MASVDRDAQSAIALKDLSRVRTRLRIKHARPIVNRHRPRAQMRARRRRRQQESDQRGDDAHRKDPTPHHVRILHLGVVGHHPGGNVYDE